MFNFLVPSESNIIFPTRQPLSAAKIRTLKANLNKTLKVGAELEFNLQQKPTGDCKGENPNCICVHSNTDCWKVCISKSNGFCNIPVVECKGLDCIYFIPTCIECKDELKDCEGCIEKFNIFNVPETTRQYLIEKFKPSIDYGRNVNSHIFNVVKDGSLQGDGGAEIITNGRRVDFFEFKLMFKKIVEVMNECGGYMNERSSIHMHLLTSHYGSNSELEETIPEIVVANFWQLVRLWQAPLIWLTIAGKKIDKITRWEKFRVSILNISPLYTHMQKVNEFAMANSYKKYGFINLNNTHYEPDGSISIFHSEFRQSDGIISPTILAALACLYHAIMIKAVEISRYGLLEIPDSDWLKEQNSFKNSILNNTKDWNNTDRFSYTPDMITDKKQSFFKNQTKIMLLQLKHILNKFDCSYEVLNELAEKPCALRLIEGDSWDKIESDFDKLTALEPKNDLVSSLEFIFNKTICLNSIINCKTEFEWVSAFVQEITKYKDSDIFKTFSEENLKIMLLTFIEDKKSKREISWSDIGAYISNI